MTNFSHLRSLLLFTLILLGAGCEVQQKVNWLPDSSGIIFTEKGGACVSQFDLKRNAKRILVTDAGLGTDSENASPLGLRSDGLQFAVAVTEIAPTKGSKIKTHTSHIRIYDIDGNILQTTKPFTIQSSLGYASDTDKLVTKTVPVDWSGPKNKICFVIQFSGDKSACVIYDCSTEKYRNVGNIMPLQAFFSAVRPDGKGFVGMKNVKPNETPKFVFVEWDGWISESEESDLFEEKIDGVPSWDQGRWRGKTFILKVMLTSEDAGDSEWQEMEFDTDLMKLKVLKSQPVVVGELTNLASVHKFSDSDLQICSYSEKNGTYRLELQNTFEGRRKVLGVRKLAYGTFYPSPDDKKVAISKEDKILIFDEKGLVAEVDREVAEVNREGAEEVDQETASKPKMKDAQNPPRTPAAKSKQPDLVPDNPYRKSRTPNPYAKPKEVKGSSDSPAATTRSTSSSAKMSDADIVMQLIIGAAMAEQQRIQQKNQAWQQQQQMAQDRLRDPRGGYTCLRCLGKGFTQQANGSGGLLSKKCTNCNGLGTVLSPRLVK
ncbi:hypothetical protein OAK32_01385 [Mariniblastus sp.]|nr:hypothetical protein [Mariniblastus sp.]